MNNIAKKKISALTVAAFTVPVIILTGCSSSDNTTNPTPNASITEQEVLPPLIIDPAMETSFTIQVGEEAIIDVIDPSTTTVEISDPNIATVTPGGADGDAILNPSVIGVSPGVATLTVTEGDGSPVSIEVSVV